MEISENMKKEVLEKAKAYVESEKNSSVLNFQVWKDKDKLDPEQWIAPQ